MAPDLPDLDFDAERMQVMGRAVLDRVVAHLASLPDQPSCGRVDELDRLRALREGAPEDARGLDAVLGHLFEDCIPRSFTTPGPGYLAYVPGGGLFPAALGDLVASATNRFVGCWQAAPGIAQLETNVLDWFREWMCFPETTRGLLTSGGSGSTQTAIVCAREKLLGKDIRAGVVYASREIHHSLAKAARLCGIHADRVRLVGVDARYRLRVDELREAIAADRDAGLRPFLVASSAGTIHTGAVDPLDEIADVCEQEGLWHHADGAYGGFFHLVPELRPLLAGLPRADSLALDPHKGLFLPYGTGALLVRDGSALFDAHAATAGYLPAAAGEEFYDISQHGPELSRPFRGLRVWMCVQLYGVAKLRAAIAEKRKLALVAAEEIAKIPGMTVIDPPQLSLFAFKLGWPGASVEDESKATRELLDRVRDRGKVMLSGCELDGRFVGRVCVLCFRTRRDRIDDCVRHLREESVRILAARAR